MASGFNPLGANIEDGSMINASRLLRYAEPRAVTKIHLGEYSGHFLQGASAPFIPDLESPVEEPDGDNFRLMHDGFEDEREPLDGDEYVRLVHRWNVLLAGVLVVIGALLIAAGRL